ncbi:MAG: hypothetical protein BM562_06990 [Alphaproteobacteria bacterium MedPE-SWcel]|nr:MAG: hypothetical protein BM562_06990 [Alphaproteobacteria bacterium MedPE-SWcel]
MRFQDHALVVLDRTDRYRAELAALEPDLLRLATFARGWNETHLGHMRRHFKIEPFYNASAMVLIFRGAELVGTAGVDTTLSDRPAGVQLLHLCSVNFMPDLRNSGLVALLLVLLADHGLVGQPGSDQVYFTSISQSPLVYSLMSRIAPVHPDGKTSPPGDVVAVARQVVAKYDPHLALDPRNLTLRGECDFFYREMPYVADKAVNALFDSMLDVPAGDVFVNVARSTVADALGRIDRYRRRFAQSLKETAHA